jgi:N-carbamoylputrescine amidase
MKDVTVAAVCMNSIPGRIDVNLERTAYWAQRAGDAGAEWVCFPELSVTGYVLADPMAVYGEWTADRVAARLARIAQETGVILLAGLIDPRPGPRPAIAHGVYGPEGIAFRTLKTHLGPPETDAYQPGDDIRVHTCAGLTFGIQICYEVHFPEISTVMALNGAEILFMPHASPRSSPEQKLTGWLRHLTARAFDNGVYVVACNAAGESDSGLSFPSVAVGIGPDGRIMDRRTGTGEGMLLLRLKEAGIEQVRKHRMSYFLPRRRPECYGRILSG